MNLRGRLDGILYPGNVWLLIQRGETFPSREGVIDHIGWRAPETQPTVADLEAKGVELTSQPRPMTLPNGMIELSWSQSCQAADADYAVYEGMLGDFSSHTARNCSTGGSTDATLLPGEGHTYYLVAPLSADSEGSHGLDAAGHEREPTSPTCYPQVIADCPLSA